MCPSKSAAGMHVTHECRWCFSNGDIEQKHRFGGELPPLFVVVGSCSRSEENEEMRFDDALKCSQRWFMGAIDCTPEDEEDEDRYHVSNH
ncbi:hypothetical protein L1987_12881 [Smallanthus sonchifolius]|uniref:Uncharacterized protein n=1 Tax=Smallanthus sonchifolius TaxID=185202 RepID=A0ACB9JFE7_9ASTR|nr:hypothetical protein L1987_12881 [Smallanthus sonchifolius]